MGNLRGGAKVKSDSFTSTFYKQPQKLLRMFLTHKIAVLFVLLNGFAFSEPIVLTGKMLPWLIGKNVQNIRVTDHNGLAIPFQIDEVDSTGDYICNKGKEPNFGNGKLDENDEIVFMHEDADSIASTSQSPYGVAVCHGKGKRFVTITDNQSIVLSSRSYISYNEQTEKLITPYYYAVFGHNRFHFTSAGVKDFESQKFVDLTNELRIKIFCKALWGLLPISYTEDNLICFVKRYKVGSIRLIRRGDFHLNLGLLIQGSRAAVNQICYPNMVRVPVYVHLPVRFRLFFSQAYLEMTPVLRTEARGFSFEVPKKGVSFTFNAHTSIDTLVKANPNHACMVIHNSTLGYGWLLDAAMEDKYLVDGSGFLFSMPSTRIGLGECGFRITMRDLPKGYYYIGNWVLFSRGGIASLTEAGKYIIERAQILVSQKSLSYYNELNRTPQYRKQ